MSITFPIFFGLMFGDIGHGLLLIVSILGLYAKKNVDLGGIGNYIIEGAPLLLVCSVFSIFCGFLYGEFFGLQYVVQNGIIMVLEKALMLFR